MPKSPMRPPSGPQKLALAAGHESTFLFALMDGGALHLDAGLRPGLGERMGEAGSRLARIVAGPAEGRREERSWAPDVPEWAEYGEPTDDGYTLVENGAVIDITGFLMARGWQGYWSCRYWPGYRDYVAAIAAANEDSRVDFIFPRYDTAGGNTNGMCEAAAAMRAMNAAHGGKPIVGHVGELCCSAGMALAAQCDALYASDGATVGSIGARILFIDAAGALERWGESAHVYKSGRLKDMGAWWREPSEEEDGLFQLDVNHAADRFYAEFAAGRGMDIEAVRKSRGWEAQTFTAGDPPPPDRLNPMREDVSLIDGVLDEEAAFVAGQTMAAARARSASPQSTGAADSRAAQAPDSQAAASKPEEPTMAKLSAQLAALLAKKKKGELTTAEAADLKALQAMLADSGGKAEDDNEDTEAEDESEDTEAEDDNEDTEAEDDTEDTEAEDDNDNEDKSAAAARLLDLELASQHPQLAGRLALRVSAGRMTYKEAVADLKAAGPGKGGLADRMAAARRDGASPGDGGGNRNKESALVASAREMAAR